MSAARASATDHGTAGKSASGQRPDRWRYLVGAAYVHRAMNKLPSTLLLATMATAALAGGVAQAQEAGTSIPPSRADLSVNFPHGLRLEPTLTGSVSSRLPASYTATPTIAIGGAIGTSGLRTLLKLKPVTGHAQPAAAPLRIRMTLSERRRVRAAERRLHRRAVLLVRLTGTFDTGAKATPHLREFIIQR